MTGDDAWLDAHRALAGLPRVGAVGRRILVCGHQVGGPYDGGIRNCDTCNDYLIAQTHGAVGEGQ